HGDAGPVRACRGFERGREPVGPAGDVESGRIEQVREHVMGMMLLESEFGSSVNAMGRLDERRCQIIDDRIDSVFQRVEVSHLISLCTRPTLVRDGSRPDGKTLSGRSWPCHSMLEYEFAHL